MTLTPEIIRKYESEGTWPNRSLIEIFDEVVRRTPDKIAIVGPDGRRMTYAEVAGKVDRIAGNLAAAGVQARDVISLQVPNWPEFVLVHLAATRLGAVTNPLLPNYRSKELSFILKFASSKVAVIPATFRGFDYPGMYAELKKELPDLRQIYAIGSDAPDGMTPFAELLEEPKSHIRPAPPGPPDYNEVTLLVFTSGTESTPKGVMHSHNTLMYSTAAMARLLGLTSEDVVWTASPLGHGTAFEWGMRQALVIGGTLVLQDIWDVENALKIIERERCTFTLAATPFASMLLESPTLDQYDLSSFRIFACAGAPIPEKLGEAFRRRIGCTLIGMWGMTECFVGSASPPDDRTEKLWKTDGKAMPGAELAIFDATRSKQLPPGEVGELATRGPHVCLGYFNDPQRTRDTFSDDGWLFSNDLATIDAEGYIRLVGRKKDVINRGGLKVSVREVEELLLQQGSIVSVALVAVPDERLGEKGCAFVVPRDDARLTLPQLVRYLEDRGVAKYKLPEYLVVLREFPMTASGKIQKFKLREDFVNGKYGPQRSAVS
ncbi:MAG: AMP-binding protein [Betaproteobacteria bacterium]|nr:AMP-binding protein [Betaproteobacteria bacterium]